MTDFTNVPIRPDMRPILQTLANEINGWRTNVATAQDRLKQAEDAYHAYVDQCAELLGLDPPHVAFDVAQAVFTPRPRPAVAPVPEEVVFRAAAGPRQP